MARPKHLGRKLEAEIQPNTKRSSKFIDESVNLNDEENSDSSSSVIPPTNFSGRNAAVLAKMTELLREKTKCVAKVFRKNKEDNEFVNDWKLAISNATERYCCHNFFIFYPFSDTLQWSSIGHV